MCTMYALHRKYALYKVSPLYGMDQGHAEGAKYFSIIYKLAGRRGPGVGSGRAAGGQLAGGRPYPVNLLWPFSK